jgi:hypothetical protein
VSAFSDAILQVVGRMFADRSRRVGTVVGTSGTQVIVAIDGTTMTLPRLKSYAPVNGETVHIDTAGDGWLVLGASA